MNLKGLEKLKEAGLFIGVVASVVLVAFAYAEMTSYGSYPPPATQTPAPSPNNIRIHGWSDYNLALLSLTDTFIKNNSYDNYTCNATLCTFYAYLDNDNYTKQRGTVFIANFSKSNVYFNDSEGVWRNISDLSNSHGTWNYSSSAAGYTADPDTVMLLKFDEASVNAANDTSRFGNNGTWTGSNATRLRNEITNSTNCAIGNCLSFDGTDDFFQVPDSSSLDITKNMTIEAWIKRAATGANHEIAIKNGPYDFRVRSDDKVGFQIWDGAAWGTEATGATSIAANAWYHVAATFDGSNIRIYVNGMQDGVLARSGQMDIETAPLWIGAWSSGTAIPSEAFFNGVIDELKIVGRTLSADEIRAEYYKRWNTTTINYELAGGDGYDSGIRDVQPATSTWLDEFGNSLETGLVGYWKMSEGSGTTTADASGYGNTGTLTGMNTSNPAGGNKNDTSGWNETGCKFGACLTFDGVNDYLDTADAPFEFATGDFTISLWAKPAALADVNLYRKFATNGYELGLISNGAIYCRINDADEDIQPQSVARVVANSWYHIACVNDRNGNVTVYINGKYEGSASIATIGDISNTDTLAFAGKNTFLNGMIDEARVYNRALTPDEIKRLFDSSAIKLKNDFTTVSQESYLQMNMTNYTGQNLFNTPSEEIKIDGNPISNIYTPANGSHTTYFYDWKQNDWAVWAKENYGKDMVGWWKFDEGAGGKANDWTNNGNAGTLTGMNTSNPGGGNGNWTSGWNETHAKFGQALVFDGANDFVNVTSGGSFNITKSITIGSWVKLGKKATVGSADSDQAIVAYGNDLCYLLNVYGPDRGANVGKVEVGFASNCEGYSVSDSWLMGNTVVDDGQWHHLAFTYDGAGKRIYVDGMLDASETTTGDIGKTGQTLRIGTSDGLKRFVNGTIDDVKIWNRSLSAEEIRLEYENKIKQSPPDWNDPRFKEQFRWKDEFKINNSQPVNITYLMTAHDPFVRVMVDINATNGTLHNISIPLKFTEPKNTLDEGLVLYAPMEEGSGTSSYDYSGYKNTGTLTNMNTSNPAGWNGNGTSGWNVSGRFGNALVFDGVNDYVKNSTANWRSSDNEGTIEVWFRSSITDVSMSMFSSVDEAVGDQYIQFYLRSTGKLAVAYETTGAGGPLIQGGTTVNDGNWHHGVLTSNDSMWSIFVDGIPETLTTVSGTNNGGWFAAVPNRDNFAIGARIGSSIVQYFNGAIDEVRIYNRSLSLEEVKQLYYIGQTKIRPGNYYYRNTSSESVLWTAQNFREAYRGKYSEGLESLFTKWDNATAKTTRYDYSFNSTLNQHFLFSQGYSNPIDARAFIPANVSLGFSSEPLEAVVNSSLSYYDLQDNDLVLWLKMNEGWGSLNATDSSGWGNNGVLTNMNITGNASSGWKNTDCKPGFGFCMNFDSVNDYVTVANSKNLNFTSNDFTVGLWFAKASQTVPAPTYHTIISSATDANSDDWWGIWSTNTDIDNIFFGTRTKAIFNTTNINNNFAIGEWHYITMVKNSTNSTLYVDSVFKKSVITQPTLNATTEPIYIMGNNGVGGNRANNGSVDDVKIWRRALSEYEIKSIYESQAEEYPNYFKADKTSAVQHSKTVSQKYDGSLAGYWKFDDGSGTQAGDASGSGNNGTLTNMNTSNPGGGNGNGTSGWNATHAKFGQALVFDGVNDLVSVSDSQTMDITNSITVSAWVRPNSLNTFWMVSKRETSGDYGHTFALDTNSVGAPDFLVNVSGVAQNAQSSAALTTGAWTHLVGTYDGSAIRLYINGVLDKITSAPGTISANNANVLIGGYFGAGNYYFNGAIDDVKIYSRSLTADEIKQQYLQTHSQYYDDFNTQPSAYVGVEDSADNGLVGYWKFDEATGSSTKDESGLGNTGTWTGTANATWNTSGKFGSAMSFDGLDDYVTTAAGTTLDLPNNLTLSAWVNRNSGADQTIINRAGDRYIWQINTTGVNAGINLYLRGGWRASGVLIPTDAWKHLTTVFDGTNTLFYVDGVLQATVATSGSYTTGSVINQIGAQNNVNFFNGTIDEVKIWNRSLSSTEIYNDYIAKNAYFNKRNATANSVAHTVKTTGNETTINYDLTDHDSAAQYDYDQRLLKIEGVAGDAQPHLNITTRPARYSMTESTWFNISVEPCAQWCNATLEANFTGAYANYTMPRGVRNEFYYNLTTPVGINQYRFYARTSDESWRITDYYTITQDKATPVLIISNGTASVNTSGLVGHWRFEQSNGSAATNDSSGYGNMGTLNGMNLTGNATSGPTLGGRFGSALRFDGVDDYVGLDLPSNLIMNGSFSVSAWVNLAGSSQDNSNAIIEESVSVSPWERWHFKLGKTGTTTDFRIFNDTSSETASAASITLNTWTHVAGTFNLTHITVFVNGISTTKRFYGNINNTLGGIHNINIGAWRNAGDYRFNGTIDEVMIFNRSLTADEIQLLYQSVVYGNQTNTTNRSSTSPPVAMNFYRNQTIRPSDDNLTLGAGSYYYLLNTTGNANYTAQEFLVALDILKATPTLYSGFNVSSGTTYGEPVLVYGNTSNQEVQTDGTLAIYLNGSSIKSGTGNQTHELVMWAGISEFNLTSTATANYTGSSLNRTDFNVSKSTPVLVISNGTAAINTTGLVGYWRFEQSNGSAAINDSSGYGNMGTLTNMNLTGNSTSGPTLGGRFGNALVFDGVNDKVNVASSSGLNSTVSAITVLAWVKINSGSWGSTAVLKQYSEDIQAAAYSYRIRASSSGTVTFTVNTTNGAVGASGSIDTTWHHLAGVYNGTGVMIYIDGALAAQTAQSGNIAMGTADIRFGSWSGGLGNFYNGTIDEVQIWNRSLTADEINMLYQSNAVYGNTTLFTQFPNKGITNADSNLNTLTYRNQTLIQNDTDLVGYWNLDNNTNDLSGYGDTGAIIGSVNCTSGAVGVFGSACQFDATNLSYINISGSSVFDLGSSYAFSLWVKPNPAPGTWKKIISTRLGNTGYEIGIAPGNFFEIEVMGNGNLGNLASGPKQTSGITPVANKWHHLVWTSNGTNASVYVNSISYLTTPAPAKLTAGDEGVLIGSSSPSYNESFNGTIDEVRIYNRSLTAQEIIEMYNQTRPVGYEYYLMNTTGNQNYTSREAPILPLQITQATPTLSFGFNATSPKIYPNATAIYGNISGLELQSSTLTISRNGTTDKTGSGNQTYGIMLPAGIWQFNLTSSATENYTASFLNQTNFIISQGILSGNLYINRTQASQTWTYPNATNATATTGSRINDEGTLYLLRNGTEVGILNGANFSMNESLLGASIYNFTAAWVGSNYTFANITYSLTVEKATPNIIIYLNGSYAAANQTNLTYPNTTIVNGTAIRLLGNLNASLSRNNTLITDMINENLTLSASFWNYTAWWAGDENYTANQTQLNLTILKGSLTFNLYLNGTEGSVTYIYPNATNATGTIGTRANNEGFFSLLRNGSVVGTLIGNDRIENSLLIAASVYNYSLNASGFFNYTITDILSGRILTINKGNATVAITYNASSGFDYEDPLSVWANISLGDTTGAVVIYHNGTEISRALGNTSSNRTFAAGIYNFSAYYSESQNWTNATTINSYFTINKGAPRVMIYLNGSLAWANNTDLTYPNATIANTTVGRLWDTVNATLFRNNTETGDQHRGNESVILPASFWNYTAYYAGDENYTANATQLNLTILKGSLVFNLYINDTESSVAYTYPNGTNATLTIRPRFNNEGAFSLLRNGTPAGILVNSNLAMNESILAAGIYNFSANASGVLNYTITDILSGRILTINRGNPNIALFLNDTQSDVSSYVYNNPTNVTAYRTSILFNNEGTLQLWRNDTSIGSGGPGNISEILVLPAGIHNYSAILLNVANYTYSNVSYVMTIQKATPILGIAMNNSNNSGQQSGAVLYLSFDENASSTAYDSSGYGNDATWTGGANNVTRNLTGKVGNALTFDGKDDYISMDSFSGNFTELTIMAWIKPNFYKTYEKIVDFGNSSIGDAWRSGRRIDMQLDANGVNAEMDGAASGIAYWSTTTTDWTHLAMTWKGSGNINLYANGNLVAQNSTNISTLAILSTDGHAIGSRFTKDSHFFNGSMDEVRIYNYSMSAQEINDSAKGVWNDIPLQYHAIVNTSAFVRLGDSSAAVNLTRNGTRISNGTADIAANESVLLAAGIYQYNISYWESQNYSAKNVSKILNIVKAPTFATLWLNETNANRDYNRSETINATGLISTPFGFFSWETKQLNLTFNYTSGDLTNWTAVGIITGANNTIYNITSNNVPGAYNFTLWFNGDENYSASFATHIASVYGNLWVGLNNPLQVYYAMNENVTLNITIRDFLRGDEISSVNASMNLTSFWANRFKNIPYYSRNASMLNFVGGNYSGRYNVTDLHAGNYSLNYTAVRDFYRVGRNFTMIYINESANANITTLFVNVSANITQNQAVLVNGSIDRIGNIEVNGTIDITIRKINPDNVGLVVANASALDVYEAIYNSTLVDTGYNVTLVDDDTVNANTWTPSVYNVIVWAEASYDNFFMQYIDDNIWSQVTGGKPLVMTYYGMIKGAVDLNLSTGWGGRFQRDVNVKTPHSVTGNYTAINVSEIQDAAYSSLYLFDFRGTELADDGTSGRTLIGVNDTNGGRIVVYGPYRANHWTAEAKDIFLRSIYWAVYGTAQTTFSQTQNVTVPYTFEDYFNESDGTAEGWNATIGSWIVQNNAYIQTANATADTGAIAKLKNNSYWTDYTVSMRFSMLGGVANNTQIYFRYDGSSRYYLLNVSSNGEFALYKNTGSGAENITDASPNLITIGKDTWYTLNITARENRIEAEIGGLGRINATDASGTIIGGTIALGTHRSSSRFDNVAVYHHDGGNKRGTHYFKREWPVGTQSPGSYRATTTFTYYNTTGNRTILASSVDFNVTSNLTAQINITLNSTLLSTKQALAINGNITAGGNLAVTGNFTLSVWNLTHEITNIQNTSRSVTPSSIYTISETWLDYFNASGNYSVRANYSWNGGSDSQLANFTISYNVSADVNVTVNAPKFNASTNATINITVNNPMQVTITTLVIACNVNDYNGLLVASAATTPDIGNRTIGSISANAAKWNSTQWNVSANNAGTYSVRCNVSDASGLIGFDVRSFDITRINATLAINANRTGTNYTVNDAVGVQGNITAVGGINASGRLVVEVYNASQRISQVYSANAVTAGLNSLNITALNIAFLTHKNLTGVYTLNATFNYTNETGSEIVRTSTTQFNISSTTNATLSATANKASYTTTETAVVTTVITSLANEAITNGNLTVYIFNSTTFTPAYRQYWNSSLFSISSGGSATQTDTVSLAAFLPGTQYVVANFTFGGQVVNVTSTFTISIIVPTTNLTIKFFVGDATNYMVYTTASGEIPANKTNASSEWTARWIASFFNDSVIGLYGTGGGVTVSASNTTTEHQINANGMIRESKIYAIVTKGTRASFQNRAELLDQSKFTTQINPSFGYPLREKNLLSLKLKYDDIDVQGAETLLKGNYRLRIENNGTNGGKTMIHIKTI